MSTEALSLGPSPGRPQGEHSYAIPWSARLRYATGLRTLLTHYTTLTRAFSYLGPTRFARLCLGRLRGASEVVVRFGPATVLRIPAPASWYVIKEFVGMHDEGWSVTGDFGLLSFRKRELHESIPVAQFSASFLYLLRLLDAGWHRDGENISNGDVTFPSSDNLSVVYETFELGLYDRFPNLEGKVVFDIGANVGDSAVWFAQRGARVEAFEPVASLLARARENLKLNRVEERVRLHATAVGSLSGPRTLTIPQRHITDGGVPLEGESGSEGLVRCERLSDLVRDDPPYLLKLDCEGCEFDLVLNDYAGVRACSRLAMEWHEYLAHAPVGLLLRPISRDFEVELLYGWGRRLGPRWRAVSERRAGMIYATRRTGA